MPPARVVSVAPGSPAALAGVDAGDEVVLVNGDDLRDVISYQLHADGPHVELEVRRGGLERTLVVDKPDGSPLGPRARERGVRPRAHLRQPLPVLLHLPTAEGHAEEPLPQGRRLPVVVPLRKLHNAHPLHRSRHRTGDHRAARAAVREHPRHRSRRAHAPAPQPARRDEPALARTPARRRHRGARPSRRVPRHQRRRGARRHAARRARPLPEARDARRGAARRERTQPRARDAPAHRGRSRGRHRRRSSAGRRGTSRRWAAASSTRPTSTTCSRAGPSPSSRTTTACAQHENGIGMARTFEAEVRAALAGEAIETTGVRSGFFAWVDGAPADGYRAPRTQPTHHIGGLPTATVDNPPITILTGDARRAGARTAAARAARERGAAPGRQRVLRRQHRRHRFAHRRRPEPRCSPTPRPARATCCPMSRCRAVASSTARPSRTCPHPVEIVPTDGASLVAALRS